MRIPAPAASGRKRNAGLGGQLRVGGPMLPTSAFSLIEVVIAMGLFFIAIFAILDSTSQSVSAARLLQTSHVDATSLAAAMSLTNRLEEGSLPSDIVAEFEKQYPGYACNGSIMEIGSNGLFQVDFEIYGLKGRKVVSSTMSIWLYRPNSGGSLRSRLGR